MTADAITVAATEPKSGNRASFQWEDPLLLEDQLTEEERMMRDSARAYARTS